MNVNASEVLERTADTILERGWCQNELEDPAGRVCLLGALHHVLIGKKFDWEPDPALKPLYFKVMDSLEAVGVRTGGKAVANWNNAPKRTQKEVIETLRRAASHAREDEMQEMEERLAHA